MENGKICPKCYGRECTKNGIIKNKQKKIEKVDILELDEMCINFKKKYMDLDICKSSD